MKEKYIIVDIETKEFFHSSENGRINIINTLEEAKEICGIYEFPNAWICKLEFNHIEPEERDDNF